ncbi:monovalent cation/H+ antiporter subunit A, partial [Rhodovulum sulfidophilum]|nr:monovalent cation/H+ antiporter subunit A [Rhodovulum sulfidophilum]
MIEQNLLLILVTLPFLGALVAASLPVNAHNAAATVSGLVLAGALAILAALHPAIAEGQVLRASLDWVPSLGLGLDIRLDGFAWMFVTLVAAIGGLVV